MNNDETLSNKEMDRAVEMAEADTQAVVRQNAQRARQQTLTALADRLKALHETLESKGDRGTDWSLAHALEDRIGAFQELIGDIEAAEALLKKHNS